MTNEERETKDDGRKTKRIRSMSIYLLCYLQWNKKPTVSVMFDSLLSFIIHRPSSLVHHPT